MTQESESRTFYVLDTNVLVSMPDCLVDRTFADGEICIPEIVISELEKFKKEESNRGNAARIVGRHLRERKLDLFGASQTGSKSTHDGGAIRIVKLDDDGESLMDGWSPRDPDQLITKTAKQMMKANKNKVLLVTDDSFLASRAQHCGVEVFEPGYQEFANGYIGQRMVFCKQEAFAQIFAKKSTEWTLPMSEVYTYDEATQESKSVCRPMNNEFFVLKNEADPRVECLGRYNGVQLVALQHEHERPSGVRPRSCQQKFLQEALTTEKDEQRLVIIEGPAGTAKTFYTLAAGLAARNEKRVFEHFYVIRANVEADRTYGYLPGTMEEKFDGFMQPVYDNLMALGKFATSKKDGRTFNEHETNYLAAMMLGVEGKPLNFLRGRDFKNCLIFVDEAQNLTKKQAEMVSTRAGEGSVVVLAGNIDQIDGVVNKLNNGLMHIFYAMMGDQFCWSIRLCEEDVERSAMAKALARRLKNISKN